MARIRTVKPEFWSSEQIVECSPIARLLFIGLWNFADDNGVIPLRPRTIKMQVFPGDAFDTNQVEEWISELEHARLVGRFEHSGETFLAVTGWHHQKIERPTYKYPKPPKEIAFGDTSTTDHRYIAEHSPPEGNGMDGKGERVKEIALPKSLDTKAFRFAWGEFLDHLRHRTGQVMSAQWMDVNLMDCARRGHDKAIRDIKFSIEKNARTLLDGSVRYDGKAEPNGDGKRKKTIDEVKAEQMAMAMEARAKQAEASNGK